LLCFVFRFLLFFFAEKDNTQGCQLKKVESPNRKLEDVLRKYGGRKKHTVYISKTLFADLRLPIETFLRNDVHQVFHLSPQRLFILSVYEGDAENKA
jgi:hypothetical protein